MATSGSLEKRKEDLITEIFEAFRGVTRQDGVSWSEADVIDGYGSEQERRAARESDRDSTWQSLVDDPNWDPDTEGSRYSFLDAVGFRYYLAPSMVRMLRGVWIDSLCFHLTLPRLFLRDHTWDKWTLVQGHQRRCVRDFVLLMRDLEKADPNDVSKEWQVAWQSYWADAKITGP